jgi:hypothetical protein
LQACSDLKNLKILDIFENVGGSEILKVHKILTDFGSSEIFEKFQILNNL